VFLAYASEKKGVAFIDRTLYLSCAWTGDTGRRAETGVPEGVRFATEGELAKRMLKKAFDANLPSADAEQVLCYELR